MKNLYIYRMSEYGKLNIEVWEDVKITRDKGLIVSRRSADYNISHGYYKRAENLDKIIFYPPLWTEYISIKEENINNKIKNLLLEPFILKKKKEQKCLQDEIDALEKIKATDVSSIINI